MYKQKSRSSRRWRQYNFTQDHHNNVPFGFIMRRSWIGSTIIRFRGKFLFIFAVKLYFGSWERKEGERKKIQKEDAAKAWDLNLLTHAHTTQHTTSHRNSTSSFLNELNYLKTHKQLQQQRTPLDAPPLCILFFVFIFAARRLLFVVCLFLILLCRGCDVDCVGVWSCAFFCVILRVKKIWSHQS